MMMLSKCELDCSPFIRYTYSIILIFDFNIIFVILNCVVYILCSTIILY
jgi:hypothetical protein